MKLIVAAALIALAFTTGFTCSKNTPAPEATAPAEAPVAAPAEGQPAPTDAPAATPADAPVAAPETK